MPKIVDHDERRRELIAAAWRVIARDGLANTTTRSIAQESGYSHGVLAHYFADKNAILDMALETYFDQTESRLERRLKGRAGLDALRQALLLGLPTDRPSRLANQVLVAFWGRAAATGAMRDHHYSGFKAWEDIVRELVTGAVEAGEIDPRRDVEVTTDLLLALVDGLGAQAALFPAYYPRRRLVAAVDETLSLLRSPSAGS